MNLSLLLCFPGRAPGADAVQYVTTAQYYPDGANRPNADPWPDYEPAGPWVYVETVSDSVYRWARPLVRTDEADERDRVAREKRDAELRQAREDARESEKRLVEEAAKKRVWDEIPKVWALCFTGLHARPQKDGSVSCSPGPHAVTFVVRPGRSGHTLHVAIEVAKPGAATVQGTGVFLRPGSDYRAIWKRRLELYASRSNTNPTAKAWAVKVLEGMR